MVIAVTHRRDSRSEYVKEVNISRAYLALLQNGPLSRAELARSTQLSRPTASNLVDEMIQRRLVVPAGRGLRSSGRTTNLVDLNLTRLCVLGVDVGATATRLVVSDAAGQVRARRRIQTRHDHSPIEMAWAIWQEGMSLASEAGIHPEEIQVAALGVPGVVDPASGRIRSIPTLPALEGVAMGSLMSETCHCPVIVENDVNLEAIGEANYGAGRGVRNLVLFAIGTGVGAGVILGGKLMRGTRGSMGEVGLMPIRTLSGSESTLRRWEDEVSTRALESRAHAIGAAHGQAEEIPALEVLRRADEGDLVCTQALEEYVAQLSVGVAAAAAILDPDRILLSGRILTQSGRCRERLTDWVHRWTGISIPILPAALGDFAGAYGAIRVGLEQAYAQLGLVNARELADAAAQSFHVRSQFLEGGMGDHE